MAVHMLERLTPCPILRLLLSLVCRPIELPDGRPVYSYPLVAGHMMKLFDSLFALPKLL
jgi:hypothetical protein